MQTDIKILSFSDIQSLYGFNQVETVILLNTKGCPLLPRKKSKPYKVIQDEFEKWLRSLRK